MFARSDYSSSQQTAPAPGDSTVLVTHPFHPYFGQRLPLLYRDSVSGFDWVVLLRADGSVLRIPCAWTDLALPDPFLIAAAGRARFRLTDLLDLRTLLDRLLKEEAR